MSEQADNCSDIWKWSLLKEIVVFVGTILSGHFIQTNAKMVGNCLHVRLKFQALLQLFYM